MRRKTAILVLGILVLPALARGESLRLGLVVGNNAPLSSDLEPLHYADDDAFRYGRFFGDFLDEVTVLARPDEESRSLYETEGVLAPTRDRVLAEMDAVADRAAARAEAGDDVVVYFVFSGHGDYDAEGRGYLHLEDGRLTTRDLFYHLVGRTESFKLVLIIDACNAGFLVRSRGAEERRPAGRSTLLLEDYGNVGLVLSSSSVGEVKEWGRYLSGIFSHQVRSGLSGVADADGNGQVTFQELAAFVAAANRDVENPELRLTPYIRPPLAAPEMALVDLSQARFARVLALQFEQDRRVTIQDGRLIRHADFHLAAGQPVRVGLPTGELLVRIGEDLEYVVPATRKGAITLDGLVRGRADRLATRGIDRYYARQLFKTPYGEGFAREYLEGGDYAGDLVFSRTVEHPWYENPWGWVAVGSGLALIGTGGALQWAAGEAAANASATPWADQRADENRRIARFNDWTAVTLATGSAALVTGVLVLALHRTTDKRLVEPDVGPGITLLPSPTGAMLLGRF